MLYYYVNKPNKLLLNVSPFSLVGGDTFTLRIYSHNSKKEYLATLSNNTSPDTGVYDLFEGIAFAENAIPEDGRYVFEILDELPSKKILQIGYLEVISSRGEVPKQAYAGLQGTENDFLIYTSGN